MIADQIFSALPTLEPLADDPEYVKRLLEPVGPKPIAGELPLTDGEV